jgi:hypothetical protein
MLVTEHARAATVLDGESGWWCCGISLRYGLAQPPHVYGLSGLLTQHLGEASVNVGVSGLVVAQHL